MNVSNYFQTLANPFANSPAEKKLLDGSVERSAGIRLRRTGEITLNTAAPSYIAVVPGLANNMCWQINGSTVVAPTAYSTHISSDSDRAVIKHLRLVGTGLRLYLNNSNLENEGYWEAARVPFTVGDFTVDTATGIIKLDPLLVTGIDLSNHQTYQTGQLKDLHRMQFGLNSRSNDHDFIGPPGAAPVDISKMADPTWDVIIIKLHGRADAASPSVLFYDVVSTQEIVYKEDTIVARLMTKSPRINRFEALLDGTRFNRPAVLRMI